MGVRQDGRRKRRNGILEDEERGLQALVEAATGRPWDAWLKEMRSAVVTGKAGCMEEAARRLWNHAAEDGGWHARNMSAIEEEIVSAIVRNGLKRGWSFSEADVDNPMLT